MNTKNLYEKLNVENRAKLVARALEVENVANLVESLKEKSYFIELTIAETFDLFTTLDIKELSFVGPLNDLFDGK
jgi:hypothetical protein